MLPRVLVSRALRLGLAWHCCIYDALKARSEVFRSRLALGVSQVAVSDHHHYNYVKTGEEKTNFVREKTLFISQTLALLKDTEGW